MPSFSPVKQTRVSDEIMRQLKKAILSGQYLSGEKLPSERELTDAFQASRVVVREAIRGLEIAGFVTIRQGPRGGAYVQKLAFDRVYASFFDLFLAGRVSVEELIQARQLMQPEVARLAAMNVTPETARKLNAALKTETTRTADHEKRVRSRMATDLVLAEMCGNRLYQAVVETLIRLTQEIIIAVKPAKVVFHDQKEHDVIIDAVLNEDGPAAAAAMSRHLNTIGAGLVKLERDFRRKVGVSGESL
jgi:GntR family transcriptional repressor for pyruvate dehydrogenase complex